MIERRAAVLVIGKAAGTASSLLLHMFLARVMSIEEYADVRKIIYFLLFFPSLFWLGLPEATVYFLKKRSLEVSQVISTIVAGYFWVGLIVSAVFFAFQGHFAQLFNSAALVEHAPILTINIFLIFLSAASVKILIAGNEFVKASLVNLIPEALCDILAICILWATNDLQLTLISWAFLRFLATMYLLLLCRHFLSTVFTSLWPGQTRDLWRRLLIYCIPIGLAEALNMLRPEVHKIIIANAMSPERFAVYITGCLKVPFVGAVVMAIQDVLFVDLLGSNKMSRVEFASLWRESISRLLIVLVPLATFLVFLADEVIAIVYSEKFLESVPIFQVSLLVLACTPFSGLPVLQVLGKTRQVLAVSSALLVVNIVLILAMVHRATLFEIAGVTVALACLYEFTLFSLALRASQIDLTELIDLKVVVRLLGFSTLSIGLMLVLDESFEHLSPFLQLVVSTTCNGILYAAFFIVGAPRTTSWGVTR